VNVRCRNAAVVVTLLLSCSLMFGAWTSLNPGFQGGVYQDVYFIPGNTQVGYACGMGLDTVSHLPAGLVIKTTDGGSSWIRQNPNTPSILRSIYFTDASTGYACGIASTVVKTTDGGDNWSPSNTGVDPGSELTSVSFPSNGQTGYIGLATETPGNAKVYKSTDGGAHWVGTPIGGAISKSKGCGMATDNIGIGFGPNALGYTTTDGFGTGSFTDLWAQGCIMTAAAFSPTNTSEAYIVGNDTVMGLGIIRYTSTSGNPHWDSVRCAVVPSFSCVEYASPETAYVGGANGAILGSFNKHDFWKTSTGVTNGINGISFPNGPDTGYAAAGPIILKTNDAGTLWIPAVAEGKSPATLLSGIRVIANPSRFGIALRTDANVTVTVFDAAGRAVLTQTAVKGTNFLPLHKAGAYFVRSGEHTARAVVTE
jgi:photosystem II stability/assembly factor-like uncharacterized protein